MREKLGWLPVIDWPALNQQLTRFFRVLDDSVRVQCVTVTTSRQYDPPSPDSLALVDTSGLAGALTLTLPPVQAVPHYRLQFLLADATHGVVIKDSTGATLKSWNTLHEVHTYVSDGRAWFLTQ